MVRCVAWTVKGMTTKKLQDEYQGMAPGLGFRGFVSFCLLFLRPGESEIFHSCYITVDIAN